MVRSFLDLDVYKISGKQLYGIDLLKVGGNVHELTTHNA